MKKIVCSFILLSAFHLSIVRSIATSSTEKRYYCFYVSGFKGRNITSKTKEKRFCNVLISVDDAQGMSIGDLEKLWKDTEVIPSVIRAQCFQKKENDLLHSILNRKSKVGLEILKQEIYKDSEKYWLDVIKKMDKMMGVPLYKMEKESTDRWKAILQRTDDQGQLPTLPDLPSEIKLDKNTSSNISNTNANSNLAQGGGNFSNTSNTVYWYWAIPIVGFLGVIGWKKRKLSSKDVKLQKKKQASLPPESSDDA